MPVNETTLVAWAMAYASIFFLGISKSGLKGLSIFNVTLLALAFGAKSSTGILMPLLLVGDVFAVLYYNRHARWNYIWRFLPWMSAGIAVGLLIGKDLPEQQFKYGMVAVIFLSLFLLIFWDRRKSKSVPEHWSFAGGVGLLAGICTMLGNLAGAFTNIFFLAMRLPKNEFVGTAAWLFLITNAIKLPLHIFVWKTITPQTLLIDLKLLPAIGVGLLIGVRLVRMINEKQYRRFILVVTAIGAIAILFR